MPDSDSARMPHAADRTPHAGAPTPETAGAMLVVGRRRSIRNFSSSEIHRLLPLQSRLHHFSPNMGRSIELSRSAGYPHHHRPRSPTPKRPKACTYTGNRLVERDAGSGEARSHLTGRETTSGAGSSLWWLAAGGGCPWPCRRGPLARGREKATHTDTAQPSLSLGS